MTSSPDNLKSPDGKSEMTNNRLAGIIDYAYQLFCSQVIGGVIQIDNEASMQLHLSNILLQVGRLNVYSPDEYFVIELEKQIKLYHETVKSKNKNARIDIWIEFRKGTTTVSAAAIELKFLKKSENNNDAVTDSRHQIYQDLENLEQYAALHPGLLICEIVGTNNPNFTVNKGERFSIADNTTIQDYKGDQKYAAIPLSRIYPVKWDKFNKYSFVLLRPEKKTH